MMMMRENRFEKEPEKKLQLAKFRLILPTRVDNKIYTDHWIDQRAQERSKGIGHHCGQDVDEHELQEALQLGRLLRHKIRYSRVDGGEEDLVNEG